MQYKQKQYRMKQKQYYTVKTKAIQKQKQYKTEAIQYETVAITTPEGLFLSC